MAMAMTITIMVMMVMMVMTVVSFAVFQGFHGVQDSVWELLYRVECRQETIPSGSPMLLGCYPPPKDSELSFRGFRGFRGVIDGCR